MKFYRGAVSISTAKPARKNSDPTHGKFEAGVSILELAIVLPVVMLLIVGVVDFGMKINSVKHVSNAARHAARVASAHSRRLNVGLPCGQVDSLCLATPQPMATVSTPVAEVAQNAACSFLRATGTPADKWNVKASVTPEFEDGASMQVVTVEIRREGSDCMICYNRISEMFAAQSKSTFVLEGECA